MTELDADENKAMSPIAEKTVEDAFPLRKSVLTQAALEPDSETSSIAPDDEITESVVKKGPRKLVEDERRAKGRISRDIWATYFKALGGPVWCKLRCGQADARDSFCTRADHRNVASCG